MRIELDRELGNVGFKATSVRVLLHQTRQIRLLAIVQSVLVVVVGMVVGVGVEGVVGVRG